MGCPVPVLSCLFSPWGLLIPLNTPGKFFWGVERVSCCGGRAEGTEAKAPKMTCHGLLSSLHRHGLQSSQLRHGLQSSQLRHGLRCLFRWAPTPPPRWNCYGVGHAFREGGVMSGFCCVCHVFPPHVSIFGLFPVLVSCHYELSMFQLCLCDCVNYPVYLVPVFWVWFCLVYSLLPGVSCLWVLPCPALMSLNIIIWVYVLVSVFLFLPRVCTVTNTVFVYELVYWK